MQQRRRDWGISINAAVLRRCVRLLALRGLGEVTFTALSLGRRRLERLRQLILGGRRWGEAGTGAWCTLLPLPLL